MTVRPAQDRQTLHRSLTEAFESCLAGEPGVVAHITGPAGIGKTTAAEQAVADAATRGLHVWRTTGSEVGAATPYGLFSTISSPTGPLLPQDPLVAAPPALASSGTGLVWSAEARRFDIEERLITDITDRVEAPTVLLVEDLHWADGPSLATLGHLLMETGTLPLVVVLTHRSPHNNSALAMLETAMATADNVAVLAAPLAPLSEREVWELLVQVGGQPPSPDLLARAEAAAGNPLLVCEAVDGLLATGADGPTGAPASLTEAVRRRLRSIGDAATVVRVAAVLGTEAEVDLLAELAGSAPGALVDQIEAAIQAGLLAERGNRIGFRHDLVKEAVYDALRPAVRSAVHHQAADVLARRGASPAQVAAHLLRSGGSDDKAIGQALGDAGNIASLVAPDEALAFLERARELVRDNLSALTTIEHTRMVTLTALGRLGEATELASWLTGVVRPEDRSELFERRAGLAIMAGENQQGLEMLEEALELAVDDQQRSPMLALASMAAMTMGSYDRAVELATEAQRIGLALGEPVGHSAGLAITGRISCFGNYFADALTNTAAAVAIADTDPTGIAHQYLPSFYCGLTALDADLLDQAMAMVQRGREVARTHGIAWSLPLFASIAAATRFRQGRLDEASAEAEVSISLANRIGSEQGRMWADSILAIVAVESGDLSAAQGHLDEARAALYSGRSTLATDHYVLATARVALANGDVQGAHKELSDSWDLFANSGLEILLPVITIDLVDTSVRVGDDARLDVVAEKTRQTMVTSDLETVGALADWSSGIAARDPKLASQGLARLEHLERPYDLALAQVTTARSGVGSAEALDALLVSAITQLDNFGADASLRDARELHEHTSTTGAGDDSAAFGATHPTETAPEQGRWSELTQAETEIVRLLAQGMTNAEIAQARSSSRRTVETHLGRVYRKLDIAGRVRLTVVAAEHFGA
jgi:DNA-binding CsgD family transcriptional regulator/tetratricopeptide (TPR) repeat protein